MGEFVVGRRCLENNLLLILPIDLRVLRLEEHQLVICHGAFEEIVGVIHWGLPFTRVHSICKNKFRVDTLIILLTWTSNAELDEAPIVRGMNDYRHCRVIWEVLG